MKTLLNLTAIFLALSVAPQSRAAVGGTWDGGGANALWSNPTNWNGDLLPGAGSTLIFPPGAASMNNTNDLVGLSVSAIRFTTNGYTLHGNALTLTNVTGSNQLGINFLFLDLSFSSTQPSIGYYGVGGLYFGGALSIATNLMILGNGNGSGGINFIGPISGAGGLIIQNTGSTTLDGTNTYTGTNDLQAGQLSIGNSFGLGAASAGTTVRTGAVLSVSAQVTIAEPLVLEGTLYNSDDDDIWTGPITLSGTNVEIYMNAGTLTLSNVVSGSGFTKRGTDLLRLSGSSANTYSGTTTIAEGTIELNKSSGNAIAGPIVIGDGLGTDVLRLLSTNQISDLAAITVNSGGQFDENGFNETIGSLAGTNGATVLLGSSGVSTLTTGGNNNSTTFAGVISGSGRLDKSGSGTMSLSGTNTFTGFALISGGTLLVNGSKTAGSTQFSSGGTLGGTGTVGTITGAGGVLAPGASPGILNSGTIVASVSSFYFELNGTNAGTGYDQLNVTGTVNLNASTLNGSVGFNPAVSNSFVIINNDGADAVINPFTNLTHGAKFNFGGYPFQISYAGGSGNDVVLTRIQPALSLTNMTLVGTNFQFQAFGVPNINYVIEASTNFLSWQPVATNTSAANGLLTFIQTNAIQFPQRFFRVLTP